MAIQHASITDANRHEAKGASTASNGQVLKANGDGTTSFVDPSTLENITATVVLDSTNTTVQDPSTTDTELAIEFGSAVSNSDVTLTSGGNLTVNSDAYYKVRGEFNLTRGSGVGLAYVGIRILVNSVFNGNAVFFSMADEDEFISAVVEVEGSYSNGTTFDFEIIRDSGGLNTGGLAPVPFVGSWDDLPSARLVVVKMVGVN